MDVEMYPNRGAWAPGARSAGSSVYLADPLVAHLPGVRAAVAMKAEEGAAIAASRLAGHRDTGNAHISVRQSNDGPDWHVILNDPDQADGGLSALAIEGQTGVLSSIWGTPRVSAPNVQRGSDGRFLARDVGGEE